MAEGSRLTLTKFTSDSEPPVPSDTRATIFIQQYDVGVTRIKAAIASKNEFSGAGDITYLADVDSVNSINEEIQTVKDEIGSFSLSMGPNSLWGYHGAYLVEKEGIEFPIDGRLLGDGDGQLVISKIIEMLAYMLRFKNQNLTFPNTAYLLEDLNRDVNVFVCPTAGSAGVRQVVFQAEYMTFPFYLLLVGAAGGYSNLIVSYNSGTPPQTDLVLADAGAYLVLKLQTPADDIDGGPNSISATQLVVIKISNEWLSSA
jgi:hypothetical protein